jgi:hypothetical protein
MLMLAALHISSFEGLISLVGLSIFFACARFSGPPNITNNIDKREIFVPAVASRNAK